MCWSTHHSRHHRYEERPARRDEPVRRADPVTTPDHLRVSDAEREAVTAQLRQHVGEGRLTLDEFEARLDDVNRARTGAELRAVLHDLPPLTEPAPARPRERRERRGVPPILVLAGVLVAVSAMVGHLVIWPVFVFFFFGFGRRWHHHDDYDEPTSVASGP